MQLVDIFFFLNTFLAVIYFNVYFKNHISVAAPGGIISIYLIKNLHKFAMFFRRRSREEKDCYWRLRLPLETTRRLARFSIKTDLFK